jgi:hypothetical protein
MVRALGACVLVALLPASAARADSHKNWAGDRKTPKNHLADAQDGLTIAVQDLADAQAGDPAARSSQEHWANVADRRQPRADRADAHAQAARQQVLNERAAARRREEQAVARQAGRTDRWRHDRATWIAIAWLILAATAATAIALLAAAVRRRERPGPTTSRAALTCAGALGFGVGAYLVSFVGVLWLADAVVFTPMLVVAAAAAILLAVGLAAGWRRPEAVGRFEPPRLTAAIGVGAALVVALIVFGLGQDRPRRDQLPSEVVALAADARANAPLPADVQRGIAKANLLKAAATAAAAKAADAGSRLSILQDQAQNAADRRDRAQRAIARWSAEVADVQQDYDRYQTLLDDQEALATDAPYAGDLSPEPSDPPSYDDPPTPSYADPPTTEDFGSGSGSVGLCSDGTLSDSIGRQGACSHHGGVAG